MGCAEFRGVSYNPSSRYLAHPVYGLGFRVQGLGFRVSPPRQTWTAFAIHGPGFKASAWKVGNMILRYTP